MMDLRHMRHFVAVAEELHFGRAAKRLNIAQPPLSQSIKRLELDLGVVLLDRSRRGVNLTEPGKVFLAEARRTLMQANLTKVVTQRTAMHEISRLNIGFIGPAIYRALPAIVVAHHAKYPEVDIRLVDRSSPMQVDGIIDGSLDVGFVYNSPDWLEGTDTLVIERCPYIFAAPLSSAWAGSESVELAQLSDEPFIMQSGSSHASQLLTSAFRGAGYIPRIVQEASQTATILSLVAAGLGCALVPAIARLEGRRDIAFVPLRNAPSNLRWELAIIWRAEQLSPTARTFIEEVRGFAEQSADLLNV